MADTRDIQAPESAPAQVHSELASLTALDRQLTEVRQRNAQRQKERQQQLSAFRRRARHSAYVFFALLFLAAGLADMLSFVKDAIEAIPYIGWIIGAGISIFTSLCVGIPVFIAQRRVKKMNEETARIAKANRAQHEDLDRQFRRLLPVMQSADRQDLIRASDPKSLGGPLDFATYKARIALNVILVQILEAIPVIDLGPWQIAKVFQVFIHQQREFRTARQHILRYQVYDRRLGLLERFEREYLEALLSAMLLQMLEEEEEQRQLPRSLPAVPLGQLTDVIPAV